MKISLEKIINKNDLAIMGIVIGVAALGTGIYSSISNIHSVKDAWEISTPISWADSYWNTLKTFVSAAKYTIPVSAVVGYIGSKIINR